MEQTLSLMTCAIAQILAANNPSVYLYGSCVLEDFRPGWSDIDLVVLTETPISHPQAGQLLMLRQTLTNAHPGDLHFRACEGSMLSFDAFTKGHPDTVVYWGTSGQRITDRYCPDAFSRWQLHHSARLLHGKDILANFPIPTPSDLHHAVAHHLRTILNHGQGSRSVYAFGWLLDTARGLYTLRHNAVISKTAAGKWALEQRLCPDEDALRLALQVRQAPSLIHDDGMLMQAEALTPAIAAFAAVLRRELEVRGIPIPD